MSNNLPLFLGGAAAATAGAIFLGPIGAIPGVAILAYAGYRSWNEGIPTFEDLSKKAADKLVADASAAATSAARNAVAPAGGTVQSWIDYAQGQDWSAVKAGSLVLKQGSKGPAVKTLQEKLLKLNIKPQGFRTDGDWGPVTENAVKIWRSQRLPVDQYRLQAGDASRNVFGKDSANVLDKQVGLIERDAAFLDYLGVK